MIACVSGEEHSFIETGQPQSSDLACRHELKSEWVKVDIGITTLQPRHGNNLINCTEISLMNSYAVLSVGSNNRMSLSFLMGQRSCSFGRFPTLFSPAALHSSPHPHLSSSAHHSPSSLSLAFCRVLQSQGGWVHLARGSHWLVTAFEMKTRSNRGGREGGSLGYCGMVSSGRKPVPRLLLRSLGRFCRVFAAKLYKDFNKNVLSLEKEAGFCCRSAGGKRAVQPSWSWSINPRIPSPYFQTDQLLTAVTNLSPLPCCAELALQTWQLT